MSMISRFRQSLRSTAGKATLAALIGASALVGAGRNARAQEAQSAATPHSTYYVPSSAHLNGAFSSFWKTYIGGRNTSPLGSGSPTTLTILAHPRGQPGAPTDPRLDYNVQPAATFDFDDVLSFMAYNGAAWLEVQSSDTDLAIDTTITYNQSPNGEKQGASYPVFDKATITTDPRLAHRGDRVEFRLRGNESDFRENYLIFVPPESNDVHLTLEVYSSNWGLRGTAYADVRAGTYFQWSTLGTLFGDSNFSDPGDTLRVTIDKAGGGDGDAFAYNVVSQVQTLNPQYQDGTNLEGTIDRLIRTADYNVLPLNGEVNDASTQSVHIVSRPGTVVQQIIVDWRNAGSWADRITGTTNELTYQTTFPTPFVGNFTGKARVFLMDENLAGYTRDFTSNSFAVAEEKNGYIANYADAKAFIMGNLDLVSKWTSQGTYGGSVYPPATWKTAWQTWFNGVNNPPNDPEVDYIVFNDVGNTMTGNYVIVHNKDGSASGVGFLPEQEFDQFRNGCKAKLP